MPQIIPRGKRFGVRIHLGHGRRKWIGTFPTRDEAWQAGEDAEKAHRSGETRETWAEFADRWLQDYNFVRKDGTLRWSERHVQTLGYSLAAFKEEFGSVSLNAFPAKRALPWVGQQPYAVLKAVRALFNDARKSGLVEFNPFERLGLEKSKGRAEIVAITEEELLMLADCALGLDGGWKETLRAIILWQGYVGCRPIATFNVRPEEFHPVESTVRLSHPGKRAKPRTVVVPPVAAEAVARLPVALRQPYLFVGPRGHKLSTTSFTHHWNKVRPVFEAKLDPRRKQELADARPDRGMIDLYELRHAAATMWKDRGADVDDVARQLCNSPEKVREVYWHPTEEYWTERLGGIWRDEVPDREREAANG